MPTYSVILQGKLPAWPKNWAVGRKAKLIECIFEKIDYAYDNNVSIMAVVESNDEEKATELGRQKCLAECNLFSLCYGYQIELDLIHIQVEDLSNSSMIYVSAGTVRSFDPNEIMASKELEDGLSLVRKAINEKKSENLDILMRSIRWHALGEMELENKVDRFVKFWIALEVLVSKEQGNNDIKRIKNTLIAQFPENEKRIEENEVIGRLYGLRKEIIHKGRLSSQELTEFTQDLDSQLRQLEDILHDLLKAELNLPRQDLSKKYFL